MHDKQIERVLAEARSAFIVTETMRPFHAYKRLVDRLWPQMQPDELAAMLMMLRLAIERFKTVDALNTLVLRVFLDAASPGGFSRPPSARRIARRLGVEPAAVEQAIATLIERGYVEEVEPGGFFRRRRFRFIPGGGDVIASVPPA
jgi:DNA-binding MarR family transcriptional regulator